MEIYNVTMIELIDIKPEDRERFWNIHQKYLYEMTNYYDDEMDEAGNYHYGYFDSYFTDTQRKAQFIYFNKQLAGFVMINPYSYLDEKPDYVMAEFTVFPVYRRKHIAKQAVEIIFSQHKGSWEVKYNEANISAMKLWNKVCEKYSPRKIHLNELETVLSFFVK